MLRKAVYPKIESLLNRMAGALNRKGFTPHQLTLGGVALNFITGWIYAGGHLFLGGLFLLLAAFGDMLDGPLARVSNRTTKFGAFLDSTLDRYSDFFVFGGLAFYFASEGQGGSLFLVMGIIAGAFVTSYAKARAENLMPDCSVGVFERPERIILLALGTLFSGILPFMLWILFFGTNATALQRIFHAKNSLGEKSD